MASHTSRPRTGRRRFDTLEGRRISLMVEDLDIILTLGLEEGLAQQGRLGK
ncbi:hypothetical protein ACFFHB_05085 [Chromohalobacter canadensis]